MSRYDLGIALNKNDFSEVGNPFSPDSKNTAIKRKDKADYDDYCRSVGLSLLNGNKRSKLYYTDLYDSEYDKDTLDLHYTYDEEIGKTYKFMGMDISENFEAVIPMCNGGGVIVGPMFDRDVFLKTVGYYDLSNISYSTGFSSSDLYDGVKNLVKRIDENDIRKIVTSLKNGGLYSLQKQRSNESEYVNFFDSYLSDFVNDLFDDSVSKNKFDFDSITLNLVHTKEESRDKNSGSTDSRKSVVSIFIGALFRYWADLSDRYCTINSELSALDLWSGLNRRVIGDSEFDARFSTAITLTDSVNGNIEEGVVSFSGISKNGGVFDQNIIRKQAAGAINGFADTIYGRPSSYSTIDLKPVLMSNVDQTDVDVWSLNDDECQALSVLDSLRYIDEDASMSRATYDMNDPDQRGLFVKSAIRSYERNFKEFKPATQYDVNDALADLVDRGDIESQPEVTQNEYANDSSLPGDVITSTDGEVILKANVTDLVRILKLVRKFSEDIKKGF
jgi:homoserine trans-succinylase